MHLTLSNLAHFLTTPLPGYAYALTGTVIVLIATWHGWRKGIVRELSVLLSIIGSIVLAKPAGTLLSPLLTDRGIPLLLQNITAITIGSILAYVTIRFLFFLLAKKLNLLEEKEDRAQRIIKIGGACIGALFGIALVLLMSWYILSVGNMVQAIFVSQGDKAKGAMESLLLLPARITESHKKGLEESILGSFLEESNPVPESIVESAEIMAEIASDPEKLKKIAAYEPIAEVLKQPSLRALMENEEIRALAEKKDIMGILTHPLFQEVANDPALQAELNGMDVEELMKYLQNL